MTGTAAFRVMLDMRVRPGAEAEFERAWLEVARGVARHPANRGQWLSRSFDEESAETTYYVLTDWTDEPSFREFELSLEHVRNRALLRPYRNGGSMRTMHIVYELVEDR